MVIVPDHGGMEVEAHVLNRDASFLHAGQTVAVKLEAFPFTRYGTVPGIIKGMSRDSVTDTKIGSNYVFRIALIRTDIMVDGRSAALNPGFGVTADIRTGSRRIISYLLSPLQASISQAGRER